MDSPWHILELWYTCAPACSNLISISWSVRKSRNFGDKEGRVVERTEVGRMLHSLQRHQWIPLNIPASVS